METISPAVLRAEMKARGRYADSLVEKAHARLWGRRETAIRETGGRDTRLHPLTAAEEKRDKQTIRKITGAWLGMRKRRRGLGGRSTINLPSGKVIVWDHEANEVVR